MVKYRIEKVVDFSIFSILGLTVYKFFRYFDFVFKDIFAKMHLINIKGRLTLIIIFLN